MAQQFIAVLYPLCVVCYYFLKYQPQQHPLGRQYSQKSLISAGFIPNLVLADVRHFSGSNRPASPWSGTAGAGCQESWQQEGEGSHKVATQSSRLACLSRVNIASRLHTVMTNRGGRAQKHYQDDCRVLPDPTHRPRLCILKNEQRPSTPCNIAGMSVITGAAPPHYLRLCLFIVTQSSSDSTGLDLSIRWISGVFCWCRSTCRYTDHRAHGLIRLQSGAMEVQHNNRKL